MARKHYPLTNLIHEARRDAPRGITYALKIAKFPECDTPPDQDVDRGGMAELLMINARPEGYVLDRDKLAGGLAIAHARMDVDEYARVNADSHGFKSAVKLIGLVLPELAYLPAVAAYVPGEPSTGFVHFSDRQQAEPVVNERFGVARQALEV